MLEDKLGIVVRHENLENLFREQVEKEAVRLVISYLFLVVGSFFIVLLLFIRGVAMLPMNPTLRIILMGYQ
ncbi:MAG: hypothetical protein Q6362_005960 [Candidatus Wukongarchaeota archaeon]|nr:hypothetical protein [Candidatus Wukongarchaeota archaeon]